MNFHEAKRAFYVAYWTEMLALSEGNITLAAKLAGVHRSYVHELVRTLGIPYRHGARGRRCQVADWFKSQASDTRC
jgi:hypothetical protein